MTAFEDDKIQRAVDLLGYEGYAYYFILLEVLARQCADEFKNPITIHQQTLRTVWRKQSKSCKKVIEKLQESGLFVATFNGNFIEFDLPNLSKYLGKYTTKNSPNSPNKKKVKESKIKENKIIKKEPKNERFCEEKFCEFWKAVPHRPNDPKSRARTAYQKQLKKGVNSDHLLERAKLYLRSLEGQSLAYLPATAKWLNEGAFNDELEPISKQVADDEDLIAFFEGKLDGI